MTLTWASLIRAYPGGALFALFCSGLAKCSPPYALLPGSSSSTVACPPSTLAYQQVTGMMVTQDEEGSSILLPGTPALAVKAEGILKGGYDV